MTSEQMAGLFRPFAQGDASTSRKFGGTGLGLVISKRLAEMLGGDIAAWSTPGRGSTFRLTIDTGPLEGVRMVSHPPGSTSCEEAQPVQPSVHLEGRSILLAEDGIDNRRLIAMLLHHAGAEVTLADNGHVAVELALAARRDGKPFDLILMDMQMPTMDGYDATQKLRDEGFATPVVALTAHAMAGDRAKCLEAGCNDYLSKPIDRDDLLHAVARQLALAEQAPAVWPGVDPQSLPADQPETL